MLRLHRAYTRRWLLKIVACGFVVLGIYVLLLASSPEMKRITSSPTNNQTVQVLKKSTRRPATAMLYIPSIDVKVPFGRGEAALEKGAWWRHSENGNPRDGGNFVLAAHRFYMDFTPGGTNKRSPFYRIGELTVGKKIIVDYQHVRYVYKVSQKFAVQPNAISIEARTSAPRLTLYSCTLGGANDGRDVIVAIPQSYR